MTSDRAGSWSRPKRIPSQVWGFRNTALPPLENQASSCSSPPSEERKDVSHCAPCTNVTLLSHLQGPSLQSPEGPGHPIDYEAAESSSWVTSILVSGLLPLLHFFSPIHKSRKWNTPCRATQTTCCVGFSHRTRRKGNTQGEEINIYRGPAATRLGIQHTSCQAAPEVCVMDQFHLSPIWQTRTQGLSFTVKKLAELSVINKNNTELVLLIIYSCQGLYLILTTIVQHYYCYAHFIPENAKEQGA